VAVAAVVVMGATVFTRATVLAGLGKRIAPLRAAAKLIVVAVVVVQAMREQPLRLAVREVLAVVGQESNDMRVTVFQEPPTQAVEAVLAVAALPAQAVLVSSSFRSLTSRRV
jgi:hypothetical protein